ncbi:Ankyrin repeat family protein [Melia azedarach]|uniref:Ankyrin repeat family protein n=1 Tax=Melia azedarach TaxID=155640 RepID=A0ACC1Y269_MELAZ|nr:Ankyrin repeat family protein [Melia azedarach]
MESMLYEAALEGNVTTLLELLQQDRLILHKVAMNPPSESPLHVAALLGHVDFVKEILCRKPELADDLDSRQCSALHIAAQKGDIDMVKALVQANPDMCFARDVDGRNPLHLAAMKGRNDVLAELVRARPLAASATTIWGETILHSCVKYNQLEALKFLLENMDNPEILNAKDDYGMTILHLAVAGKQIEMIKFLATRTAINVNALNTNGFTALDILAQSKRDIKDWDIGESLQCAGAIRARDNIHLSTHEHGTTTQTNNRITSHESNPKQQGKRSENVHKKEDDWLEKMRNALMVVASLIATMAFQAATNPPRNTEQDTCQCLTVSQAAAAASPPQISRLLEHHYTNEAFSSEPPMAQTTASPRSGYDYSSGPFFFYNTLGFMASLSIILLLISGLPLKRRIFTWILMVIIWVAIIAIALTYHATEAIFDEDSNGYFVISIWVMSLGVILLLGHTIRITVKMIKNIRKLVRRLRQNPAQDVHEPPIAPTV